jgi:short-subunit dehydrogenase
MASVFTDKWIWITGASSGIGRELALQLASRGARLVLSSRNREKLEALREKTGLDGERCLVEPLDVSDTQAVKQVAEKVLARIPRIDYLFNNAGVSQRGLIRETVLEVDRRIMEINYFGNIALTKAVLPRMIEQGGGHVVVTGSVVSRYGFTMRSAYAASKHALHGFYETLLIEEKNHNIYVTLLVLGRVVTNVSLNAITHRSAASHAIWCLWILPL